MCCFAEAAAYPQRLTYIADVGYSYNTSSTLEHVLESQLDTQNPPIVFLIGDYACTISPALVA